MILKTITFLLTFQRQRPRSRMSSIESSFSEAGESDAGGNGNLSDTGSFIANPAFRVAPGGGGVGARQQRRSVVSDTEVEQQPETDTAVSVDTHSSIIRYKLVIHTVVGG